MSTSFQASALNSIQRYLKAVLVRFRRFVNGCVADMLATHELHATRFALKKTTVLGLIVAGSFPSAVMRAEEPVVRDYLGGRAEVAVPRNCESSSACCVPAPGQATARDRLMR